MSPGATSGLARVVGATAALAALVAACGGKVVFIEDGEGQGGDGATSSNGGTPIPDGPGPMTVGPTTSTGTTTSCAELGYTECLGDAECVPLFDDLCCPTCNPGECMDCVDWRFVQCMPRDIGCDGRVECGEPDRNVCEGVAPRCDLDFCDGVIGCAAQVCPDFECFECAPVIAGMCDASCDAPLPLCPPGWVPASDGFCWTGLCVEENVCG